MALAAVVVVVSTDGMKKSGPRNSTIPVGTAKSPNGVMTSSAGAEPTTSYGDTFLGWL